MNEAVNDLMSARKTFHRNLSNSKNSQLPYMFLPRPALDVRKRLYHGGMLSVCKTRLV